MIEAHWHCHNCFSAIPCIEGETISTGRTAIPVVRNGQLTFVQQEVPLCENCVNAIRAAEEAAAARSRLIVPKQMVLEKEVIK